ncbi:MAG: molecular chaperone HtpG [Lachnospiraceae bacterium]|nr:molecular chaperone HtpG [Lachnospiraceae bacterium]
MAKEQGNLSINSENIFPIIKKWLYSDHDIFLRELVSNGCDAITKLKKLALIGEAEITDDNEWKIIVRSNPEEKTLTVIDNGIGMTADEVKEYINQIAFSGATDFLAKYKDKASEDQIIGHFGLGFYSAFMVAHKVTIDTLSYKDGAQAVHWESEEGMNYEMSDSDRTERGTAITLYLNEDSYEFSNEYRVKEVLGKYCSFMPVPIFFEDATKPAPVEKPEVIDAEVDADGKAKEVDGEAAEGENAEDKAETKKEKKGPKPINDTFPLFLHTPSECKDEEYKEFYRTTFHDYKEPLFWIHLNMDYPFNLKGILYFPKINTEYDSLDGTIKLYNNQVFIADNIKEVIPEFLMLLKGVIDCPDIPLNVSRSALQNDGFVKKISDYIAKKVADKLSGMYKTDRENYEKCWDDICPFIKYGCLRDAKFREKMKDFLIYKDIDGKYITLPEYVEAAKAAKDGAKDDTAEAKSEAETAEAAEETAEKADEKADGAEDTKAEADADKEPEKTVVYYVTDEKQQSQYINMFRENGVDALIMTHRIDQPFIQQLEQENDTVTFRRIDADVTDTLKDEADAEELKTLTESLTTIFRKALDNSELDVKVEKLKNAAIPAMITLSEESRRMQDMMKMYGMAQAGMPDDSTLVLNAGNKLVKYISENADAENSKLLCAQIYDLARLSQGPLEPADMTAFMERSTKLMGLFAGLKDE